MQRRTARATILAALIAISGISDAAAQWAFVAHRALGRIERVTQPETNGGAGYDTATVVLEGHADKVYGVALQAIAGNPGLRIIEQDPAQRVIHFTDGSRSAGLKVSQVNDTVIQLLISSVVLPGQQSATSLVLPGVLRVCKEMGATCTVEK